MVGLMKMSDGEAREAASMPAQQVQQPSGGLMTGQEVVDQPTQPTAEQAPIVSAVDARLKQIAQEAPQALEWLDANIDEKTMQAVNILFGDEITKYLMGIMQQSEQPWRS